LVRFTEVLSQLDTLGIDTTTKESVHHSTLNSFCKEQMEKGTDIPVITFGLYSGFVTKINK